MATLQVLIKEGNVEAIGLAEKAVDDFVATYDDRGRKLGALHIIERELLRILQNSTGDSTQFTDHVLGFLRQRACALEQPEETSPD